METYVLIACLIFNSVFGVFGFGEIKNNSDVILYVPDDYGNAVELDYVFPTDIPDIPVSKYPELIFFILYTRDTKDNPEILYINDTESLNKSHFDVKNPTVFVTHGWTNSYQSSACTLVRDAYLQHGDYNVIVINWVGISKYEYVWVTSQLVKVSQFIAGMIDFLASQGVDPSHVTNVGHSLGAHIAGLSSYYAKNKVYYVVALDPAGPFFHLKGKGLRVSEEDATYVLAIHSSSVIGLSDKVGTADFYVNGGLPQNGCLPPQPCSHLRAYEYFAISINNRSFPARSCDNFINFSLGICNLNPVVYMGGVTPDLNVKGSYYLITNSKVPFHS